MKTMLFITFLAIVSCGKSSSSEDSSKTSAAAAAAENSQVADTARLVTKATIPQCIPSSDGELIYVKDQKQFQYCDAGTKEWVNIDLKGEQGAQGIAGISGAAGAQGVAGTNGASGATGVNGEDAVALEENEWINPVSKTHWIVGQYLTPSDAHSQTESLCQDGAIYPTQAQYKSAIKGGILIKFSQYVTNTTALTDYSFLVNTNQGGQLDGSFVTFSSSDLSAAQKAYILCVIQ